MGIAITNRKNRCDFGVLSDFEKDGNSLLAAVFISHPDLNQECFSRKLIYAEQMDAEVLGRKLLLTPSGDPLQIPENGQPASVT